MIRGRRLLFKAPNQTIKTTDVLETAVKFNLKILTVKSVLDFCEQYVKLPNEDLKCENSQLSMQSNVVHVKTKHLKAPFMKFEDNEEKYLPIVKEFERWPVINLDSSPGTCPFGNVIIRTSKVNQTPQTPISFPTNKTLDLASKASTVNTNHMPNQTPRNSNAKLVQSHHRRRQRVMFCEICYKEFNNISEHVKTEKHQLYMNNEDHFKELKSVIDSLPSWTVLGLDKKLSESEESSEEDEDDEEETETETEIDTEEETDEEDEDDTVCDDSKDEMDTCSSSSEQNYNNKQEFIGQPGLNVDNFRNNESQFIQGDMKRPQMIINLNSGINKSLGEGTFLPLHDYVGNSKLSTLKENIWQRIKMHNDIMLKCNDTFSDNSYNLEEDNCDIIPPSFSTPTQPFKFKNVFTDITNENLILKSEEY